MREYRNKWLLEVGTGFRQGEGTTSIRVSGGGQHLPGAGMVGTTSY